MKSIVVLFIIILIAACSSTERSNKVPDRFKDFMDQYFHGYKYEYEDISARGNKNYGQQYALFKIKKNDLKFNELEVIYEKLAVGGWRLVEVSNNKNYASFCYGEGFSLDILYPLKKYEKTPSGIPLNYDDMGYIYISPYKSTTKIAECNQDPNDFIDFTKL
ncbi:hypothetical protein [Acinetobacter indicus]|uniref:hypothetical protein n=1 Tax=Acinetobacter indicus TaxID=756892 RepID=UPI001E47503B|nr:hypothetical protein [Acinetobacter indicus]